MRAHTYKDEASSEIGHALSEDIRYIQVKCTHNEGEGIKFVSGVGVIGPEHRAPDGRVFCFFFAFRLCDGWYNPYAEQL